MSLGTATTAANTNAPMISGTMNRGFSRDSSGRGIGTPAFGLMAGLAGTACETTTGFCAAATGVGEGAVGAAIEVRLAIALPAAAADARAARALSFAEMSPMLIRR